LTILHAGAGNGWFEAIPKLLTLGIDINNNNNALRETPLSRAIEGVNSDPDPRVAKRNATTTAFVLLDNGADVNARDHNQRTALHEAVIQDLVAVATRLLDLGADVQAKTVFDQQPIHLVRSTEMANLLASRGADVNALSNYGAPVHKQWNLDTMRALLRHGANPNVKDPYGQTALHNAASAAYYPSVDATPFVFELLQAGADPTIKSEFGITAAETAARDPRRKKQYADGVAMFEGMKGVKLVSEKKNLPPGVESNILGFITGSSPPKAEEGLLFQKLQTTLDYLETVDLKKPEDFLTALSVSAQTLENFGSQVSADIVKSLRALEERAKTVFTSDGADISELTADIDAIKARIRTALTTMRSRGGRKTRVRKTKRRKTLRRK
jgi:ankyrin repeat protein